ncbi:MAG: hypothetical protein M4579_005533 [Chaenotheca gracillima]|nr:MAG: hypothetical protein M4579_005533 [Chaenotheca gracillima]
MAASLLPGRPGNLTPDQEAALREFWVAVLKVFGVPALYIDKESDGAPPPAVTEDHDETVETVTKGSNSTTAITSDKKKKRPSFFGRKNKKDDSTNSPSATDTPSQSTPSTPSMSAIPEADDKYGQTRDFKLALASQTPEDLRQAFWSMVKHDHPDGLLLRFLRARKWDVEKALVMLVSTMHWRAQEMHVDDDIMINGEGAAMEASKSSDPSTKREGEDFLNQLRMGKSYLHGVDKDGRPMCFVNVRMHKQGEQTEKSLERVTVFTIETARLMLRPPVDTATIVFDMTGFSMANMDYTPVKFMIKCFEANYPESLGAVLVYKSPWIFQGWLDPVVASKVHFAKSTEELEHFIPRDHIPKQLGGGEDWQYHYSEPQPDENRKMADKSTRDSLNTTRMDIVNRFEQATLYWINIPRSEKASSDETVKQRDKLADELKDNYWQIDPFVRAKSVYDRQGVMVEGGRLVPYPHASTVNGNHSEKSAPVAEAETHEDDLD